LANSGASSLETAKFYIVTSSNNVYKCLNNNNNSPSLIQPSNTDNLPFKESDGYIWKYMYSIPLILQRKFMTPAFIPVTTSMSSRYYNNGGIDNVVVLNGGSGYHQDLTSISIVSSTGKDAAIRADVDNITGAITGVIIDDPGESYLDVEYQVLDSHETDPGSGAILTSSTDFGTVTTQQSNVELSATNGSIEHIKVETKGVDYVFNTPEDLINCITVTGDGQGCTAIPVLNSSNQIESITITNSGYDYTFANITFSNSIGHGASARAIISPFGGHGKNAIKELFGNRILFSTSIHKDNINGFVIDNDYRQFGIIKNPMGADSLPYSGIIGTPCYSISTTGLFSLSNYPNDTILNLTTGSHSGKEFVVIAAKSNTNGGSLLVQPKDNAPLAVTNSLSVTTNPSIVFRIDSLTIPSINPFSGDLLYIDNRHSFYQSNEQTISLQTTIKF